MVRSSCETHPETPAEFQCDNCRKYLCAECVEEGHRLFFCSLCGERALPIEAEAPATTVEHQQAAKREVPYCLQDALLYPFRGLGGYVFWAYVIVLIIFMGIGVIPLGGLVVLAFRILIILTLPGLLFSIVRTSAKGETELPDWPDWTDFGERLFEWFGAVLAFLVSLAPAIVAIKVFGCGYEKFLDGGIALCAITLGGGLILGAAMWIPAFGAVAVNFNPWLALRIDLHLRALIAVESDGWRTLGLLVALMAVRFTISSVLSSVPVLGAMLSIAIGIYTLFVGAHLIGLLFRRNANTLEAIYP